MKIKEGLFTSQKLYRVSWLYRLSPLLATGGVVALLWILLLCSTSSPPTSRSTTSVFLLISLVLLSLGGLLCLLTLSTCMITAPEGLLYRSMGTCVYTPWKNIEEVEKKLMGAFRVENLRLRREAVDSLSLEEGIQKQIAIITKMGAVRATEEALPALRGVALVLSIISTFAGWRGAYLSRSSNPPLQEYIPVGLFGALWSEGGLGDDVYRYREPAERQKEQ